MYMKSGIMTIVFVLLVVGLTLCHAQGAKGKQLLLNDPAVVGARLTSLERTVQDLTQSVSQFKGDLAQEKLIVSKLKVDLVQEQLMVSQLNGNLTQEKVTVSQVKADLAQEKVTVSQIKADLTQIKGELSQEKATVSQLQTELANERAKLLQLEISSKNYGSTYVRWGRKQCSGSNTEMVYTGFAAGNLYYSGNTYGGHANMLCLPNNPELSNRTGSGTSQLHGTEFEDGNFFGKGAQDEDVPCSLCRSKITTTSVMIPGRRTCYNGWKLEYNGVLASGHYTHKPSSYICVDSNPEYLQGGDDNKVGHLLYGTTTKCGSLPCPPYGKDLAVNCVICSK